MKSKALGNIQDTIRRNVGRLMVRAKYIPKTLSEAASLNRGYIGSILTPNERRKRSMGPEAIIAVATVLGRALGRDERLVVLEILGFDVRDLRTALKELDQDATPLEETIKQAQ